MHEKLSLSVRKKFGYEIIDIKGEITFPETKDVEDFIKNQFSAETKNVILNLERVPFINSSALSILVKLMQDFQERGIEMYIMNPNDTIRGLFEMTGIKKYFKFIKSEDILTEKLKLRELDSALELDE